MPPVGSEAKFENLYLKETKVCLNISIKVKFINC